MTEFNNLPFSGIMVAPRPMPDFSYPHFVKWYSTSTWISSSASKYAGHVVSAGRNFQESKLAQRLWHQDTPPARIEADFDATVAFDLTTPYNMLADTAGATADVEDTIIGPDYYNLPIKLNQDLEALNAISILDATDRRPIYIRVNAIKHTFTYTNYSRFPLEVYYTVLPIGYLFNVISSAATIHDDMKTHTFKKIVVPAVRDAADKGQKAEINLSMNLKQMFKHEYEILPGPQTTSTTAVLSVDSSSPWIHCVPGNTTSNVTRNIPPGQIANDAFGTHDLASAHLTAGLRLQWYAKLQNPRDLGVTTEGSATAGDFVGNNYDLHVQSAWMVEVYKGANYDRPHTGEKAYPSQVA